MAALYIKEQGAIVQKNGERILVTKKNERLLDVPIFQVDNVAIIGNVQVTTPALHMMMNHGIDISYFSYCGTYLGNTAAEASKNIFLRFQQYQLYLDEAKRIDMARIIVANKIENQMAIIRKHRWEKEVYDYASDMKRMIELKNSLANRSTTGEIMGVEGMCSNIYFKAFGAMLKCDFSFNGRNRRPPKDPVNAIVSLAYTFLTRDICAALEAESFESYLGFLHGIRYGRKSLALDLIEEFRQPICDRLVLLLFNKRMLTKYDFEEEDEAVHLNEDGFRKFCHEYERWISGRNSMSGEKSFRNRIREQISRLKKSITGSEEYHPYNWEERHVCDQL